MKDNVLFFLTFKKDIRFFYGTLSIQQALPLMKEHGYTAVPVISSNGEYLGSVSEGDFLWYLLSNDMDLKTIEDTPVSELIRKNYMPSVNVNVGLDELLKAAINQNYVPVVDDRSIFIGIVTRRSLMKYLSSTSKTLMIDPKMLENTKDPVRIHF